MNRMVSCFVLALVACGGPARQPSAPTSARAEITEPSATPSYLCTEANFTATVLVDGLDPEPLRRPQAETTGSFADQVWTVTESDGTRSIGVELSRGPSETGREGAVDYAPYPPRTVKVRGFSGIIGEVEDGYGLRWREGDGACDAYRANAFGAISDADLLRFANGLRETG